MTLSKSKKKANVLIELRYGDASDYQYLRLTDRKADVVHGLKRFTASPQLECKPAKNTGALGETNFEFEVVAKSGPLYDLSGGDRTSLIRCAAWVYHEDPATAVPTILALFLGKVARITRNPQGRQSTVRVTAVSPKNRFQWPLGVVCAAHCPWTFGGRGCFLNVKAMEEVGTLTAVVGKVATITGLSDQSAFATGRYWHRGAVKKDGIHFLIRDWQQAAPTTFALSREPPASWVGGSVTVKPGCSHDIESCRAHGNEEHFAGVAFAMPSYHPSFENPF